jgi:hypothetical protein
MNKHGVRTLAISALAALSLLAFAATAQAANLKDGGVAGKFRVEALTALSIGRTFTGQLEQLTDKTTVHLVFLIPSANLDLLCTSMDIEEGKILSETEALLKAKLLGCAWINLIEGKETELTACQIAGKAITIAVKILPRLHDDGLGNVELYLLFEGDSTNNIGTIKNEGEECALGPNAQIEGSAVALVKEGSVEQVTKLYSFSEAIQLLFQERVGGAFVAGDQLKVLNSEAFLDGNVTVSLTGSHVNKKWSVI